LSAEFADNVRSYSRLDMVFVGPEFIRESSMWNYSTAEFADNIRSYNPSPYFIASAAEYRDKMPR